MRVVRPAIAVTTGDPNGIGPEIAVKAAAAWADRPEARVVLFGDAFVIGHYADQLGVRVRKAELDAPRRLTPELIVRAADAAAEALRALGLGRPRIGVFGINPHAGEGGLFGDDDTRVTLPAVEQLRARGLDVHGPVGADLMLSRREGFDAFVAMYHDQGHIPVKLLAGRGASALSIGAGTLFSSVGHGAAFDIAGKGEADPEAVMRTIALLCGAAAAEHPVTRVSR
jgi:4-hydroxy-L-threonine phosphate dehydrogenase PdxA